MSGTSYCCEYRTLTMCLLWSAEQQSECAGYIPNPAKKGKCAYWLHLGSDGEYHCRNLDAQTWAIEQADK